MSLAHRVDALGGIWGKSRVGVREEWLLIVTAGLLCHRFRGGGGYILIFQNAILHKNKKGTFLLLLNHISQHTSVIVTLIFMTFDSIPLSYLITRKIFL